MFPVLPIFKDLLVNLCINKMNYHQSAQKFFLENRYDQVINIYEEAIATEPDIITHYWYLGLAYLLQNQEEIAQTTWLLGMSQVLEEEVEQRTEELIEILDSEALRQVDADNLQLSWLIRQHIRELAPNHTKNLLYLINLTIDLGNFAPEQLDDWQAAEILQQTVTEELDLGFLLHLIKKLLEFASPQSLIFLEACLPHYKQQSLALIDGVMTVAIKLAYQVCIPSFAANIAEICLQLEPEYPEALKHLSFFSSNAELHRKAIETAKRFFNSCTTTSSQVFGGYILMRALLGAAAWREVEPVVQRHKSLILELIQNPPEQIEPNVVTSLSIVNFFLPSIEDQPQKNRLLQNQVAQLFQKSIQNAYPSVAELPWNNSTEKARKLKIGYIAHTLRGHSVGWLSRWLFQYYDCDQFETHLYLLLQSVEDHQWFRNQVDSVSNFTSETGAIATKIKQDGIDILVDLDSITLDITSQVMALKPAPVQVTWLGWDASGIPAIDYYIADPYVLPEDAQEYYSEKIWRLPETYVAVDGFEVSVPTLRREHLDIPSDAVIYFSAQNGYKRHPDTVRLQMRIISQVPNSYFLIKGRADEATLQEILYKIAEEEGVTTDRFRFLPRVASELIHRANLGIADVVLDTYPYNGATTTLETLWMGVPLVTRVGQQFAARNSYTFLKNAGVDEGIAWTDEEYVEWGVRLGLDPVLRQQISWKLRQSRQTAPLWNAEKFTRELEKAYKQMWERYVEANQ